MKKTWIGLYIIASAIIWGAVILGCAYKLSGTDAYEQIRLILAGGAGFHLIIIWGPLVGQLQRSKEE